MNYFAINSTGNTVHREQQAWSSRACQHRARGWLARAASRAVQLRDTRGCRSPAYSVTAAEPLLRSLGTHCSLPLAKKHTDRRQTDT